VTSVGVASVGVIGGGTAGWLAALAVKRRFPQFAVTVVESRDIPIIGVGEATTTLMPPFLHAQLGLDPVELFRAVKPTFKLGIRFEWGARDFNYPFGDTDPISAAALDGDLRHQSLTSMLMDAGRVAPSLLPRLKFAYHLDNAPFVAFLKANAISHKATPISHEEMTIGHVARGPRGIDHIRGSDGRELRFDFWIDATGFRALLGESPFLSYSSSLFCDRAIVANVPQPDLIRPYTTAETMPSGWCWRIPVMGEDHRGYVHSSAFVDEETAIAEMRARNPGIGEPRVVHFRSGRHRDFWSHNCVAIGNAYGFVEPLESTALHMIIVEIAYLIAGLEDPSLVDFCNQSVGAHWDFLRWFLAVHYKFNSRLDTPFWRAARADTDISGIDLDGERQHGDPAFGKSGLTLLLLGQQAIAPSPPSVLRADWDARVARDRQIVERALPQREALATLDPRSLDSGWVRGSAERVVISRNQPAGPRAG
jgi:tryptophan halogenase